jgi:hypothetical protein
VHEIEADGERKSRENAARAVEQRWEKTALIRRWTAAADKAT